MKKQKKINTNHNSYVNTELDAGISTRDTIFLMSKKSTNGITLIALVITVVVLLILAGISITMLAGDNSIFKQATSAKEQTEITQIKERAEIAKLDLDIQSWTNRNSGVVKRNALVSAINKEFEGSKISGSVVTTSDNKYDIIIDSNLDITVVKHQATNTGISFSYIVNETESRAVVLDVYPIIESLGEVPTYEEYATEYLETVETDEQLIQVFVDGFNYTMKDVTGGETLTWNQITGGEYATVQAFYDDQLAGSGEFTDYKDMMISLRLVDPKGYSEKYGVDVAITCNGETQTINSAEQPYTEFAITKNGEYTISLVDSDNNKTEQDIDITECKEETYSSIYTANTELTIDGYKVTVPAGFAIGTSENVGHVTTGLVITDSVDGKGNSTGNEFVWIPVKEDLTVGNTGKLMSTFQDGSTTNYRGVLYNWYTDQTGNTTYTWSSTSTDHREPAYLTDSNYADNSSYNQDTNGNQIVTADGLQNEYNEMISSVKEYGGFYVARYEMAIENGNAISKLGVTPTTAYDEQTERWYGLYSKAKTYINSYNSIKSSMIWGSQYDAMLNFALANGNDSSKVHSTEYGNYSGTLLKTGLTQTSDVINNIYDLAGNLFEWTLEAGNTFIRVYRGGYNDYSASPSSRGGSSPDSAYAILCSRLSLYVK